MRKGVLVGVVVVLAIIGGSQVCGEPPSRDLAKARGAELRELLRTVDGPAREPPRTHKTKEGYLRFLMAPPSTHFPSGLAQGVAPKRVADAFLGQWRGLFVSESPRVGFEAIKVKTTASRTYVRYQEMYAGLKVFGAEMIVQVNGAGGISAVISDIMRNTEELDRDEVPLGPSIDEPAALASAVELAAEKYGPLVFEATAATLMIYCPSVLGHTGPVRLVWQTVVSDIAREAVREFVLVDAESGEIALHYSLVDHAMYREIWDCWEPFNHKLVRWEGGPDSNDPEVNDAYYYVGNCYNFFKDEHGRISVDWNDIGLKVEMYDSENATWKDPNKVLLGKGLVAEDVVGHEFVHLVDFYNEVSTSGSGPTAGIHESLADMWGEWIDEANPGYGNDAAGVKWLVGEDCNWPYLIDRWWPEFPEGIVAIRYMKDPTAAGIDGILYEGADRMSLWDPDNEDYYNAGIGNKLAYLLTDGDTFNGYTIWGMGISDTADLFYECMTNLLTSSVDYEDLGNALMLAAVNLGWSQSDRENVERACRAVEIDPIRWFYLLDGGGSPVACIDNLGNATLKGNLTEGEGATRPSATGDDEFIIRDSTGNLAVINTVSGDMFIYGWVKLASEDEWEDPDGQEDEFIVKDAQGNPVAYIDELGNLYLKGQLYEEEW